MTKTKEKIYEGKPQCVIGKSEAERENLVDIVCGSCDNGFTLDAGDIGGIDNDIYETEFFCPICGVKLEIKKVDAVTLVQRIKDEFHGEADEDKMEEMLNRLGELAKKGEEVS